MRASKAKSRQRQASIVITDKIRPAPVEEKLLKSNSVVLLGDFNPAIFSPEWVRNYVSLTVDEGDDPEVKIIHPEITDFMLSDIQFTIERNRVILRTLVHDIELMMSIAIDMFSSVLKHTPIWAYGVNFERHVDFLSFEARNKLGRLLCPLEPWGEWASSMESKDPLMNGGLSNVTMKKILSTKPEVYKNFTIQPSNREEMSTSGVFFAMNNHFGNKEYQSKNNESFREELFSHLREYAVADFQEFDRLVQHFMNLGGLDV